MVAYSFKARFAQPIIDGTKTQTIRAPRKRHARSGEELQLYTGMRTKQCKLIRVTRCLDVQDISVMICGPQQGVRIAGTQPRLTNGEPFDGVSVAHRDAFARMDGFKDWRDMSAFWIAEHPDVTDVFRGVLIRWAP